MEKILTSFDDIVRSKGGQHISIYLKNDRRLRTKAHYFLDQIQRILLKHHSLDETRKMIKPLHSVFKDKKTITRFGENIALFKRNGYMRIISIPSYVEEIFVLSKTFHVKPLLNIQQQESCGTLIFCEKEAVSLVSVGPNHNSLISQFRLDSIFDQLAKSDENKISHSYFMLGKQLLLNWLEDSFENKKSFLAQPVLVYGEKTMAGFVTSCLKSATQKDVLESLQVFRPNQREAIDWSRARIKRLKDEETLRAVNQFSETNENQYISYDIQEILYNLLAGHVRKLMVAKDQSVFGKIDENSAQITYTHFHKDHEDDDLLDDISQMAIERGITPILVKRGQIRKQRLLKAVIEKKSGFKPIPRKPTMEVA